MEGPALGALPAIVNPILIVEYLPPIGSTSVVVPAGIEPGVAVASTQRHPEEPLLVLPSSGLLDDPKPDVRRALVETHVYQEMHSAEIRHVLHVSAVVPIEAIRVLVVSVVRGFLMAASSIRPRRTLAVQTRLRAWQLFVIFAIDAVVEHFGGVGCLRGNQR